MFGMVWLGLPSGVISSLIPTPCVFSAGTFVAAGALMESAVASACLADVSARAS